MTGAPLMALLLVLAGSLSELDLMASRLSVVWITIYHSAHKQRHKMRPRCDIA